MIALPLIISISIGAGVGALLGFGIGYLNSPTHYAIEFPKSEEKTNPEPSEPESRETVFQDASTETSGYSQAMKMLPPPTSSSSLSDNDENILLSDALELIDQICKNAATDPQPLKAALYKYINSGDNRGALIIEMSDRLHDIVNLSRGGSGCDELYRIFPHSEAGKKQGGDSSAATPTHSTSANPPTMGMLP